MRKVVFRWILLIFCLTWVSASPAQSEADARRVLNRAFSIVENPTGVKMDYQIKVKYFFNQSGTSISKGNKSCVRTKKGILWFDGNTVWTLDRASNVVTINTPEQVKRKGLTTQFAFAKTARLSMKTEKNRYRIKMKNTDRNADFKEGVVFINRKTYEPTLLRVKKGLIWVNIYISNIKTGNFADSNFTFDHSKYPSARIEDKRETAPSGRRNK